MLITGAARGIGAAVARAAAPTYDLVVNFVASADAAEAVAVDARALGAQVLVHRADVGVEAEVVELFAATDDRFGRVDVLVNNAGIAGGYGRLDSITATALTELWAVNITGAFVCAREAVRRMSTTNGGRGGNIVNISSKAAVIGGPNEWIHYAASKGAIDTMTAGLAKEVAAEGIRVNAVRPGLIESDFHLHATPGRVERMAPLIPMQRSGSAAEVAAAVLWLASAEASYVTGAFVDVTGGR
ncbi:MAG: short chain dehydrogenase [Ilumatobacteraceae bacterium]|nr:short chain dehydrogenase [Ilumatobacteraceae bacterium]